MISQQLLIDSVIIQKKIKQLGSQIENDFFGKNLCIVMVLKGALFFTSDLMRSIDLPMTLETVQCSSYGEKGAIRGELSIFGLDRLKIENKDVLIVDDIFDSGKTMETLSNELLKLHPKSIKTCVLLKKRVSHHRSITPDYYLFDVEDLFVVGYGLDYKEYYRNLPGIYTADLS